MTCCFRNVSPGLLLLRKWSFVGLRVDTTLELTDGPAECLRVTGNTKRQWFAPLVVGSYGSTISTDWRVRMSRATTKKKARETREVTVPRRCELPCQCSAPVLYNGGLPAQVVLCLDDAGSELAKAYLVSEVAYLATGL